MDTQGQIGSDSISRDSFPAAAQQWLERSLPRDFDPVSAVLVEQEGEMDIRGNWIVFKAQGTYNAAPLSFSWKAKFRILSGVWVFAEDGHAEGEGWGGSRL